MLDPGSMEAPTQRGITERAGKTFKEVLSKTLMQTGCTTWDEWRTTVDVVNDFPTSQASALPSKCWGSIHDSQEHYIVEEEETLDLHLAMSWGMSRFKSPWPFESLRRWPIMRQTVTKLYHMQFAQVRRRSTTSSLDSPTTSGEEERREGRRILQACGMDPPRSF